MNFHQPLHCYIVSICCFELSLQSIRYAFGYEWEKQMHNFSHFARYANGYLVSCSLWKQRSSFLLSRFPEFVHTHNTLFDSHRGEISSHFIPHYYTFLGSIRLTSLKLGAFRTFHLYSRKILIPITKIQTHQRICDEMVWNEMTTTIIRKLVSVENCRILSSFNHNLFFPGLCRWWKDELF